MMDNPSPNPASALVNDESSRVKFLCSFSGSILPRPQDGKLRYVGGETRIVSVPRNITYEELMARMRELYEGASILKYQQPDEDLDALVSVVNDDDVTNMMEEYDKLGSGDGFTRLRIFLFSHPDQDVSPHYVDGDETERRYVDALNSLNELPDYRRQQQSDSPVMTPADEIHIADQFFNSINLDGSQHNQRNYEIPMSQYNLRHLAVPAIGSPQHSSPVAPRYNDELPWSPAYYSPRFAGRHDTRTVPDFPSSPSSARYLLPFQDVSDKCMDRMPEECMHQHVNHQPIFDQQQQFAENMLWVPTGGMPAEKGGFPGNILHAANVFDGSSVCEQCRIPFQRNQSTTDFQRKLEEQSHLDQVNVANGHLQVGGPCVDCGQDREALIPNSDPKLQYVVYDKEQSGPRSVYGETQCPDRSWVLQHQLNPRREELRDHISGAGRISDRYVLDSNGMNIPLAQGNLSNGQLMPSSFVCHGDPRHVQTGTELGNEVVHSQTVSGGPQIHVPLEERVVHPAYSPSAYGTDIPHQMLYGHPSAHALWRNVPTHVHIPPTYDTSSFQQRNGTASPMLPRGTVEGSPRVCAGGDQNPWVDSSHKQCGFDGSMIQENAYAHAPKLNSGPHFQENRQIYAQDHGPIAINLLDATSLMDPMKSSDRTSNAIDDNLGSAGRRVYNPGPRNCNGSAGVTSLDERIVHGKGNESVQFRPLEGVNVKNIHLPEQNDNGCTNSVVAMGHPVNSNMMPCDARMDCAQMVENTFHGPAENTDLSFLPDLIASAKKAKLENAEVVKARVREDGKSDMLHNSPAKDANPDETESVDGHENSACGSDNANFASKIEPTKAEEEAIARGLQTIKNDDLEEVRELGSGTYGAVYHGKWKGSDVAIKRIKASCFAGRPSERERLIADFWKEALILSSLHHPNVVSFYGIVRDGPDGSLATVTEFMVNGSLKQYLQKKDRTIDRRKRLIIAMDAAFGMEYLHGKNIVHFDLKCENLLVNMRDPHRPVCKIGDLGLSKVKQHTLVSGGVRGTLPWMAPELLSGKSTMVTEKVDVYSFGIVMWELLTGEEPYKDVRCASIIGGIVNNMLRPEIPTWCDPEWKSLMESCWASDPAARPSFSEISQKLRSMAAAMNVK